MVILFLLSSLYCLLVPAIMLFSSLYGKFKQRDKLLSLMNLQGNEKVLDVGCGKGLLLIGAAQKLTTGKAYGIDIWSKYDLLGNAKAETVANAQEEGVASHVEVIDANACAMPFDDNYFDRVISSLVVHNIPTSEERAQAIKEMVRVTKPGGIIAIQDFMNIDEYSHILKQLPVTKITLSARSWWIFPPVRIVMAQKIINH